MCVSCNLHNHLQIEIKTNWNREVIKLMLMLKRHGKVFKIFISSYFLNIQLFETFKNCQVLFFNSKFIFKQLIDF